MEISASTPVGQARPGGDESSQRKKTSIPQPKWASVPPPPRTSGDSDPSSRSNGHITSLPRRKREGDDIPAKREAPAANRERRAASPSHLPEPRQTVVQAEFQTPGFSEKAEEPKTKSEPPPRQQPVEEVNGHADTCIEKGMLLDDQWLLFYCPSCSNLIKVDTEHTETAIACSGCGREFSLEVESEAE